MTARPSRPGRPGTAPAPAPAAGPGTPGSAPTSGPGEPSAGERILDVVDAIPAGRVLSYGDIADYLGLGSARMVGRALAGDGDTVPWHRVVHADGTFAAHLALEQRRRLLAEGVEVTGARVDIRRYRWSGPERRS